MKRLRLRIPAELHRRLADRASRGGRSIEEVAVDLLRADLGAATPRRIVRARAAARGILRTVETPPGIPPTLAGVRSQLAAVQVGATELITEQRGEY